MIESIRNWDGRIHGEQNPRPSPHFRPDGGNPGARDRDVWQGCFVQNEYKVTAFEPGDVVVDIGMHIGSFVCLAHHMGSRHIFGFEVDKGSYDYAVRNAAEFGPEIEAFNVAVVRSDHAVPHARYAGNWNIFVDKNAGEYVAALPLDAIIESTGPVRYLKIDCEGSEFPILYTCTKLAQVKEISGEWHEWLAGNTHPEVSDLPLPCTAAGLQRHLEAQGFTTRFDHSTVSNGNFWARRP